MLKTSHSPQKLTTSFSSYSIPAKFVFNPRLVMILVIALGMILFASAIVEIKSRRDELKRLLDDQAISAIGLVQKGVIHAASSYSFVEELMAQKLLDNARLLEVMDYQGQLNEKNLTVIAQQNRLYRVNVFDIHGRRVLSNARDMGAGASVEAPRGLLQPVLKDSSDELILGFRRGRFGAGERYAVAKHRRNGGAIVVNIDAQEMLEFRRHSGAGIFIKQIGETEGVRYAVLQDTSHVIMASKGVQEMNAIAADSFLKNALTQEKPFTRFAVHQDQEVFEVVHVVSLEGNKSALLRIGLSTDLLRKTQRQAKAHVILVTLLLLVFGVFVTNSLIGAQNYRLLQKAYARVENYAAGILTHMNDALIAVDQNGAIMLFNPAAEKMFDMKREDVIGRQCRVLSPVSERLQQAMESGRNQEDYSEKIIINDRELYVTATIKTIEDSPRAVFAVLKDLTQQRRLEENLKRQEQMAAMSHLASGVAHEIRNPLNAISLIAQRLHSEFKPIQDVEEYQQMTGALSGEAHRINNIIGQFLQFARPAPLNKTGVKFDEIVSEVVALLNQEAEQQQITLKASCTTAAAIQADTDKMKQVLFNIVRNSIQACRAGDTIEITCRKKDDKVVVQIIDSGEGIQEENMNKIFNLYFTTREHGSGLGLSIVQQIVSQHDGVINVSSRPGAGTTFTIFLPMERA